MLNKILAAILLTVCAVPAAAIAQDRPIKLESDVKLVRQVEGGAPELVAPEGVVPGDTLVFTTSYRNEGAAAVNDFVIVNPVPSDLVLTDEAAAEQAVQAVERLRNEIGIPRRLRDIGVVEEQLRPFAEKAFGIRRILRVNPRPASVDDLHGILREAF